MPSWTPRRPADVRLGAAEFEALVADAIDSLPEHFATLLDNVHVVVEAEPSADDLAAADVGPGRTLFGLYHGVPQTERGSAYTFAGPDRITIFRGPLLRACASLPQLRE